MEAASSSEALAPIYATTQRHISEVRNPEANKEVWGQHVVWYPQQNKATACMKLSDKNMCDEAGLPDHPVHN